MPFFPLEAVSRGTDAVLGDPPVMGAAARLHVTPAQVALAWALELAPNLLLIPGTSSQLHLAENVAAQHIELDGRELSITSLSNQSQ